MRMIKLIILIFALNGGECRHRLLKGTSGRDTKLDGLAESAVLELLSCYEKKVDTVGAIGMTEPTLVDILMTKQPLPVKLFEEDKLKVLPNRMLDRTAPHKLHLFVAETHQHQRFHENILTALRSQRSADLATFLIIDWPSQNEEKGCSLAYDYLWEIWRFSVLNAFYVCVDKLEDRVLVYTFNPYRSQAPTPWMLNKTLNGFDDHPWSLFVRDYRPDNQQICSNLDFVKTHDLGGYTIRSFYQTGMPFSQLTPQHLQEVQSFNRAEMIIARYAIEAFNATHEFYLMGTTENGFMAGNFRQNLTEQLINVYADIFLPLVVSIHADINELSFPMMKFDYVVVTHHRGEKSQLDKLIGVFDRKTRFGICLVIVATLVFFKFFMRQALGTAAMNVVRIIGNTGLLNVPNGNAPRLYLAGVFILVVTIIGVYQGLLASLLTKPTPLPEVDTFEDLANSPHKIHIPGPEYKKFFTDPRFEGRLVTVPGMCRVINYEDIVIPPSYACLLPRVNVIRNAIQQNRHVSKETIVPAYAAYSLTPNWALEERFNEILASYVESGNLWPIFERDLQRDMAIAEYKDEVEKDRPVTMNLSNLGFAFAFLGIGLTLATIVFAVEVAMKRRHLRQP